MIGQEVDNTECRKCGGTLAIVGPKEEANGWKYYCDCTECGREYGARYVGFDEADQRMELAKQHVRSCSV